MKDYMQSGKGAESFKKMSTKSPKKSSTQKKVSLPLKNSSIISKEFIESEDDSSMSESDKKSKIKIKSEKVSKFTVINCRQFFSFIIHMCIFYLINHRKELFLKYVNEIY